MIKKKELVRTVEYWMETIQNELFRQFSDFMVKEGMNKTELAIKLNVSKGYVSQILNGTFNFTLKKLIELSLSIGKVPFISFITPEEYLEKMKEKGIENPKLKIPIKSFHQEVDTTLNNLEILRKCDDQVYEYFLAIYLERLHTISAENKRISLLLEEMKDNPTQVLAILKFAERFKDSDEIKLNQNKLSIVSLAESIKSIKKSGDEEISYIYSKKAKISNKSQLN